MKESGITWVGNIPKHWNFNKAKYHFTNDKYVVGVKSANYNRLALTLKGVIHRKKEDNEGLQPNDFNTYQLLKTGELVFKLIDLQNVSTSRVGLAHDTGIVSPAYIILHANNDINPAYAEKFFLMMWHREIFNALGDAGVRSNLNAGDLLNVFIPVPPLKEQNKIADFLDEKCAEIDSISAEIQEQIDTLEEYKKSVITEAVTKGLNPNVKMKDSGIEWIGEIPNDWEVKKLKYFCDTRNEKYFPSMGQLDYLGLENIISWHCKSIQSENEYDLEGSNLCYKNDVVFGKLRPYLAKVYLVDYNRCCSSEFAIFCNFNGSARFYKYLLVSHGFVNTVDNSTYGIKMPRANIEFIKNVYVPHPKAEEQEIIANFLDSMCIKIDGAIEDKQKQLKILDEYKKTLIYEYVTGKKEVA